MNGSGKVAVPVPADATLRFSNRVDDYIRYRPGYPSAILDLLQKHCDLAASSAVADIGSGTGKSAEMFLAHGNPVFGIEPNREMREAAERLLKPYPHFTSVAATAEATTLPDRCIDLVFSGQAFHWFDRAHCRVEFQRILKQAGWVALAWNDRRTDSTPFLQAYEQLLQDHASDYKQVNHRNIDAAAISEFFGNKARLQRFSNTQEFGFEGLKGRLLSSSYAPAAGQPGHAEMISALKDIFSKHHANGTIRFDYDTLVYLGQLT